MFDVKIAKIINKTILRTKHTTLVENHFQAFSLAHLEDGYIKNLLHFLYKKSSHEKGKKTVKG